MQTDHKPLVPLFTSKPLDELPVRVQRFRLRMMRFDFSMSHVPGKSLLMADALSRAPCSEAEASEQETAAYVKSVIQSLPATDRQLERIQRHQEEDEECRQVAEYSRSGWPSRQALPGALRMYHWVATEISVQDGLLMRGSRIVIPASLRLECWIGSTQGIWASLSAGARERAKQSVWWPGLSRQLEELVKNCSECRKTTVQRSETLIPSTLPELPWQRVAIDHFELKGRVYLLIVDYFSLYIEVTHLDRTTAGDVILHTKAVFARHGIPEVVVSDNGPHFSSEAYIC